MNETCQFKLKLLIITDQSFSEVQIVLSSELSCGSSQVSEFMTRFCGKVDYKKRTKISEYLGLWIDGYKKWGTKNIDHMTSKTLVGFNWFTLI